MITKWKQVHGSSDSWVYQAEGYPVDGLSEIRVEAVNDQWWVLNHDNGQLVEDSFGGGKLCRPIDQVAEALALAERLIERQMGEGRHAERREWGVPFAVEVGRSVVHGRYRGDDDFEVCLLVDVAKDLVSINKQSTWEAVCCASPALFARLAVDRLAAAVDELRVEVAALREGVGER